MWSKEATEREDTRVNASQVHFNDSMESSFHRSFLEVAEHVASVGLKTKSQVFSNGLIQLGRFISNRDVTKRQRERIEDFATITIQTLNINGDWTLIGHGMWQPIALSLIQIRQ